MHQLSLVVQCSWVTVSLWCYCCTRHVDHLHCTVLGYHLRPHACTGCVAVKRALVLTSSAACTSQNYVKLLEGYPGQPAVVLFTVLGAQKAVQRTGEGHDSLPSSADGIRQEHALMRGCFTNVAQRVVRNPGLPSCLHHQMWV